jgi:hypothetical protein
MLLLEFWALLIICSIYVKNTHKFFFIFFVFLFFLEIKLKIGNKKEHDDNDNNGAITAHFVSFDDHDIDIDIQDARKKNTIGPQMRRVW